MNRPFATATQRGVTLLEMLLAVIVFGGLMLMAFNILQDYSKRELARSTARFMENIAVSLEDTIRSRNCQGMNGATPVPGMARESCFFPMWQRISVGNASGPNRMDLTPANLRSGFVWGDGFAGSNPLFPTLNGYQMPASSRLGASFNDRTPYKARSTIVFTASIRDGRRIIEYLILTLPDPDIRITNERATMAANEMGAHGGYVMNPPGTARAYANKNQIRTNGAIRSAFGAWSFRNELAGTQWYNAMPASNDTRVEGTQLAYYGFVSEDSVMGDYLYRVDKAAYDPSLNRMHTTLNLGSNNIIGADNMTAATMTIDKGATVKGAAQIVGNARISGGNLSARDEVAGRNFVVRDHYGFTDGELSRMNINNLNVKERITVQNNFQSNEGATIGTNRTATDTARFEAATIRRFEVATHETGAANILRTDRVTSNSSTDEQFRGKVQTQEFRTDKMDVGMQMRAAQFTTNNLSASASGNAGSVGTVDILTRNATINNNFSVPRFNMNTLDINELGECERGCGVSR